MKSAENRCSVPSCQRDAHLRGMCGAHYQRALRGADLGAPLNINGPRWSPKTCKLAGCQKRAQSRGLCIFHVLRERRGIPLDAPTRQSRDGVCSLPGCGHKIRARGMCALHHDRARGRSKIPINAPRRFKSSGVKCSVSSCDRECKTNGFCNAHYKRYLKGRPLDAPIQPKNWAPKGQCEASGCSERAKLLTFCRFHYHRHNRGTQLDAPRHGSRGEGYINSAGYKRIMIGGEAVFEHRAVMEGVLGRRLLKSETVHHKNGDRLDNRIKNLELWSHHQPPGQRAQDKVAWAREILSLYGDLFPEKRRKRKRVEPESNSEQLALKIA